MAKNMLLANPCSDGLQGFPRIGTIDLMAPNPSNNNVTINLIGAGSASLMVVKQTGNNTVNNYILDVSSTETIINISNYINGLYTVALIVNGEVVDSKTLVKQ